MFAINHAASALLFKKHLKGEISFVWILLAVQFIELVWVFLNWFGIEHVTTENNVRYVGDIHLSYMPYSHSILSSGILVVMAGMIFWFWKKSLRITVVIMLACSSHIILDLVTHTRDLPLGFAYEHVLGLGLYSSFPLAAFLLELGFGFFCWWYARGDKTLFWVIVGLNLANISLFFPEIPGLEIYLANRPMAITFLIFAQILLTLTLIGWRAMRNPKSSKELNGYSTNTQL